MESHARLHDLGPGIIAASAFAISNVLSKVVFQAGGDVLTLSLFRGLVGVALVFVWLRIVTPPPPHTPRARWIALGLGVLFAGVVFGLFAAFARVEVPVAILSYFVYPLLTGLLGALFGIERIGWRGIAAAFVAFCGLALLIGAHPKELALAGLAFALGAALCRTVILLVTRSMLHDSDSQLTTWYTHAELDGGAWAGGVADLELAGAAERGGWAAMIGVSLGTTIAVPALFVSIKRIGPFRTALIMNLEPLLSILLSAPVLGEVITPVQAIGGGIMLAALVAFQLRR